MIRRLVLAVALAVGIGGLPAYAVEPSERLADPALEARARALSQELRCLVCQNQSIDESNADLAHVFCRVSALWSVTRTNKRSITSPPAIERVDVRLNGPRLRRYSTSHYAVHYVPPKSSGRLWCKGSHDHGRLMLLVNSGIPVLRLS
jgi:hypothetical protein